MSARILLALCCLMWCSALVRADDASHEKAVIELLGVLQLKESMTGGAEAMADAMVAGNPAMEPYRDVLITWATKTMTWESMAPELIALYKQALSEAEIRELVAFFKTKVGQKWVSAMPDLMRKGSAIGSKVGQAHQQELMDMMTKRRDELKQKGSTP